MISLNYEHAYVLEMRTLLHNSLLQSAPICQEMLALLLQFKLQRSPCIMMLLHTEHVLELMSNWAFTVPNCPDSSCHIHHDTQETNYTGKCEEVVLWEVSICLHLCLWRLPRLRECYQCFGQDTVVAIVGEPQWLVLIPRAAVQANLAVGPLGGDTCRFPW